MFLTFPFQINKTMSDSLLKNMSPGSKKSSYLGSEVIGTIFCVFEYYKTKLTILPSGINTPLASYPSFMLDNISRLLFKISFATELNPEIKP